MANWVVQDRFDGSLYDLSVTGGMFNVISSTNSVMREPIVADTLLPNTYWNVFVNQGILGYTQVAASGTSDQIYMFDSVTNQWWLFQITEGMDNIIPSNGPVGSHGLYPVEYYYRYLIGAKNVKYLLKVYGQKSFEEWEYGTAIGKKAIYKAGLFNIEGNKTLHESKSKLEVQSSKIIKIEENIEIAGKKEFGKIFRSNVDAKKHFRIREKVNITSKKDFTRVLKLLDIEA